MILLPLVLLQAVALQIFYGSHLDVVSRRLSGGVAGEIAYTLELMRPLSRHGRRDWILRTAQQQFDLDMRMEPGAMLPDTPAGQRPRPDGRRPRRGAARAGSAAVHHGLDAPTRNPC